MRSGPVRRVLVTINRSASGRVDHHIAFAHGFETLDTFAEASRSMLGAGSGSDR